MDKLVEHYGVLLGESVIRRITLAHARTMFETDALQEAWPDAPGTERIIAEVDGGMVPIMDPDTTQADRRKGKHLRWKEAKIALAHPQGSQTLAYGGTVKGNAQHAGRILFDCARRAGLGCNSQLHAVGDGATWIADQVDAVSYTHLDVYKRQACAVGQMRSRLSSSWAFVFHRSSLRRGGPAYHAFR